MVRLVNGNGTAIIVDGSNTDQVKALNNRGFREPRQAAPVEVVEDEDAPKRRGRKPKQNDE